MFPRTLLTSFIIIGLIVSTSHAKDKEKHTREWKKRDGSKLEAEFVEVKDGVVRLKLTNGNITRLAIAKLSDEDQTFIESQASASKKTTDKANPKTDAPRTPNADPRQSVKADAPSTTQVTDDRVQITGLRVTRETKAAKQPVANPNMPFQFNQPSGTEITLLITDPSAELVGLDVGNSKLDSCTDDKGTNLATSSSILPRFMQSSSPFDSSPGPDQHSRVVRISLSNVPVHGAAKLQFKGQLAILVGSGEKATETKNVEIKEGGSFMAERIPIKILSIQDQNFGPVKAVMQLESDKSFDQIKKITFTSADGKEIGQQKIGSFRNGLPGREKHQLSLGLHEKPTVATVRITQYDQVETKTIPISLEFGVGL